MMKYTDIGWDFDGALYNSYPHINESFRKVLWRHGCKADLEEINRWNRITQGHSMRHFAPLCDCSFEQLREEIHMEKDGTLGPQCLPYEGIPELLRDIAAAGIRNHICSNKRAPATKQYLDRDGLTPYFDVISGIDPERGIEGKPKPDILNDVLTQRGVDPSRMLMIGDRPLDIEAGHAAGCDGCFFDPDGCNVKPEDAEYQAFTVADLRKIILGE